MGYRETEKEEGRNETEVFTDNLIYPQEVYMSSQKKIYNRLGMTSTKDYIWSYKGQTIWMTEDMQKVTLGKKHTRSLDICYLSYQLQQAHGPSGFSCNN